MLEHVGVALKSFTTAFDTTKFTPCWAGFIWLQGETDAMDEKQANAYQTNLENLVKDLRETLKTPDLPVILPLITTVTMWTYSSRIRDADIAMKTKYNNIDTLETKNYQTPDGMHYNAAGQIKIGQITAWRWLGLKYQYEKAVSITQNLEKRVLSDALLDKQMHFASYDLTGKKLHFRNTENLLHPNSPLIVIFNENLSSSECIQKRINVR
jgi:deoxyadenosine/deoxycytidine kinase